MALHTRIPARTPRGQDHVTGPGFPGMIRTVNTTQYLTPLREGGSLPGLVEAADDGTYVLKFRGGAGAKGADRGVACG